jgi:hypothetical protein
MTTRAPISVASVFAIVLLLGAWSPQSAAILKCCYKGDAVELRLVDIQLKLENGRESSFGEVFSDFESSTSFFTLTYPVFKLDIARVVYPHLAVKFTDYDANDNGVIENPELTVLYIEEAARGLGQPIAQLGGERRLRAIFASAGDIDGLIRLVNRRRAEMVPDARKTFDEIDLLRIDFRIDGTEPGERGDGAFSP